MADNSPLVTSSQREWLDGDPDINPEDSGERTLRSRLRSRLQGLIVDFSFLLPRIPLDDLDEVFTDLKSLRRARRRTAEERDTPPGLIIEPRSEDESDGLDLRNGIIDLLAFLYLGVNSRTDFEHWLEKAIERAEKRRDGLPVDAAVTIDIDREEFRQRLEWRVEHGGVIRPIPGGEHTPKMDREVFEEKGIDEMSGEELRGLFGDGFPRGDVVRYDGEKVYRPPEPGSDEDPDILYYTDEE